MLLLILVPTFTALDARALLLELLEGVVTVVQLAGSGVRKAVNKNCCSNWAGTRERTLYQLCVLSGSPALQD